MLDCLASLQGQSSEEAYLTALDRIVEFHAQAWQSLDKQRTQEELKASTPIMKSAKKKIQVYERFGRSIYRFEFQVTYHEAKEIPCLTTVYESIC